MSDDHRARLGRLGERIAEAHLVERGYTILERNFRTRHGELDLVAANQDSLVFCEVKARLSSSEGGPFGPLVAVGPRKRAQLRRMAGRWLVERGRGVARREVLRFDAIGVRLDRRGELLDLQHVEDAF
jgi:putative endonuclease